MEMLNSTLGSSEFEGRKWLQWTNLKTLHITAGKYNFPHTLNINFDLKTQSSQENIHIFSQKLRAVRQ